MKVVMNNRIALVFSILCMGICASIFSADGAIQNVGVHLDNMTNYEARFQLKVGKELSTVYTLEAHTFFNLIIPVELSKLPATKYQVLIQTRDFKRSTEKYDYFLTKPITIQPNVGTYYIALISLKPKEVTTIVKQAFSHKEWVDFLEEEAKKLTGQLMRDIEEVD